MRQSYRVQFSEQDLPPPADLGVHPAMLVDQLKALIGERAAAEMCADLLEGADPHRYTPEMAYLGGAATPRVLAHDWPDYWTRVWGARGLRYVWVDSVAPAVVAGVGDDHWRVAEMCLKVSALRELAEAGPGAVPMTEHELPRVRETAIRTLGILGDTEHVEAVEAALDDAHDAVRRAAVRALRLMARRLDLDLDVPERL